MIICSRSSAAVCGSFRMPKSSMISSGTVATDGMYSLRVPSAIGQYVEQDMSFAIKHLAALLNRSLSDGLRRVALPCSARAERQRVLALVDFDQGDEFAEELRVRLAW